MAGYILQDVRDRRDARVRLVALGASALFVLGFSTVFIAFGASATALGQLVMLYRYEAMQSAAASSSPSASLPRAY